MAPDHTRLHTPLPARRSALADPSAIPGWGVDAETRNDPTWPMRDRSQSPGSDWPHPSPQQGNAEVLQSVEYKARPAVYGLGPQPRGLSGMMRRAAFRFSENNWWHWLLLLGADRVDMVEGIGTDLATGHVPNLPAETGMAAAWRHDTRGQILKWSAIAAVVTVVMVARNRRRGHA